MSTVALWNKRVRKAREKADELTIRTDAKQVVFATRIARLVSASDRVEAAAVEFLNRRDTLMTEAARARNERT